MQYRVFGFSAALVGLIGGLVWAWFRVQQAMKEERQIKLREQTGPVVLMFVGIAIAYFMAGRLAFR